MKRARIYGGRTQEASYPYVNPRTGRVLFEKVRYRLDFEGTVRTKDFRYRFQCDPRSRCTCLDGMYAWHWGKPPGADGYLYRLPDIELAKGRDVWWAEGEKDADMLAAAGEIATSHHGGAGKVNLVQARRLISAARVLLAMDLDHDGPTKYHGPGAWDVWKRHRLLIYAGLRADQIVIVRPAVGKDVADHLGAGLSIGKLKVCDKEKLQRIARQSRPKRRGRWASYRGGRDG